MSIINTSRRHLLSSISAVAALLSFRAATAKTPPRTPRATEGPYYPRESMRPADVDNDLVKIEGAVGEAGGEVIVLKGQITDRQGNARPGLRIEIWQCDVNGKYMHPGDSRKLVHDAGFQGFGHDISNERGEYRFRTIKPTSYPGRTPHIHVKVLQDDKELLTTQFYLKNEPANARDVLYRRLSEAEASAVSMSFTQGEQWPETTVNVVV